jgi:hypothetical protein
MALGGYAIGSVQTQVVVQNNRPYPIRIIDMRVIKSCGRPPMGTIFDAQGGGAGEIIGLGFNLDSPDTSAKIVRGYSISTANYFDKYTISISPGAQQVFRFQTVTFQHSCTFRYDATILDGKKTVHQLIGNGLRPFRVSSGAFSGSPYNLSRYSVAYVGGPGSPAPNGAFVRIDPKFFKI